MSSIKKLARERLREIDLSEARRFVEIIAGTPDPAMTYQVFDDKGQHPEWAEFRHGRLSDPKMRQWLAAKNRQGCGIYVTVNQTDGKGRRRTNIKAARANWSDFDGNALPQEWPIDPDIITESSPGRFQVFLLIEPDTDLNAATDNQARLAAYFKSDPKIIDPGRVCRMPGFFHHKKKPFRSRIVKSINPEDVRLNSFNRTSLKEIANGHPCDYRSPARRADEGRSEEPESGWNNEADIDRAKDFLDRASASIEGEHGNDNAFWVACQLNDFGISPELSLELMAGEWNERCAPPWSEQELRTIIRNANRYKENSAGANSVAGEFDDEDDFEGSPRKLHSVGGLRFKLANDIEPEKIDWLWPNRFAYGKLSMIAGFPDQGKSQITLNIAATITTGGEWPDDAGKADKGAVIILSAEDDEADTLVPRLIAAGADLSQIIVLESMVQAKIDGKPVERVFNIEDDLHQLEKLIEKERNNGRDVKLVILDPINAYFGGKNKADSHKTSDMRALLTPVAKWTARLGIAVIAISHFNKGGNAHTLYRVTDSGAITAVARAVWFAVKDEMSGRLMLLSGKNNLAKNVGGLAYMIEETTIASGIKAPRIAWDGEVHVTAEDALGARKERDPDALDSAKAFLADLLSNGPALASEVIKDARANAISLATLRRAKDALDVQSSKEGFKDGKWRWILPLNGAEDFEGEEPADDFEGEDALHS